MIRKATAADIDSVEQSYLQLLDHEALHGGHTNWVRDVYPTRATAEGALSEGTLFVLEEDGVVRGSMILNQTQLPEYAGIDWAYPAQQVLVIHTLCIPPAQAGRGYGPCHGPVCPGGSGQTRLPGPAAGHLCRQRTRRRFVPRAGLPVRRAGGV